MENNEEKKEYEMNFKSHILLPLIFTLTLVVAIFMFAKSGFAADFNTIIIWFYFAVVLAYAVVACIDCKLSKSKSKNMKIFIIIMSVLTVASDALFAVAYLLNK